LALDEKSFKETFWDDPNSAKEILRKAEELKQIVAFWDNLQREVHDLVELESSDDAKELQSEIEEHYTVLKKSFSKNRIQALMQGTYDDRDALLSIQAGTGGVDAQDFAEMLERMYLRFFEKRGFKVQIIERNVGSEAGIKKVVMSVKGLYAYGYLKVEGGVHRLVRQSPFNADHLRQTSFALVEVIPEIAETKEIEVTDDELRIDTFRAQGHGGQGVNTTDSAVRITHIPTNIVVTCQNERSQLQNKQTAMNVMKSRILEHKRREEKKRREQIKGESKDVTFGNQIRSYVLHPYKLVKDHRTKYEEKNVVAVLDGGIDGFIKSNLEAKK